MFSVLPLIIVVVLILLNGLFVAAEFALIGAPRASIERKAKLGDRVAKRLRRILNEPYLQDRYIATAQLGITLSSLGLGMYGEHMLALWLQSKLTFLPLPSWLAAHSIASIMAIAFLTYLHIVLGEMVPKSLALQKAERTAIWVTPLMGWFQILFYPLVLALNGLGNIILRFMGVQRTGPNDSLFHTSEELEFVIRESQEGGLLHRETSEVLQELLEFGDLLAREVMVPRVKIVGIPIGASHSDLANILDQASHTRYPLYENDLDHIVGALHVKDILKAYTEGSQIKPDNARPIPYVPESISLEQVLKTMREQNAQMVVVMDEYGGTAGLLTIEDLFEEIIGDIDEDEEDQSYLRVYENGSCEVDGTTRLEEVGERLRVDLEHEEVDTVGGLVLNYLGRPPKIDDEIEYKGLKFTVIEVEGHGVNRCKVEPIDSPDIETDRHDE